MSGFKLLEQLKKSNIYPLTVFVTGFEHYAIKAIRESVLDYLLKPVDVDDLQAVVKKIKSKLFTPALGSQIDRVSELTPTEKEVFKVLLTGCTSAQAARILNSSPHTINTHRNHILQKMRCNSILEAVNMIQERLG